MKAYRKWWPVLLWPVTVPLYLVFLILVYLPVCLYTVWRVKRARGAFIKAVKRANELKGG